MSSVSSWHFSHFYCQTQDHCLHEEDEWLGLPRGLRLDLLLNILTRFLQHCSWLDGHFVWRNVDVYIHIHGVKLKMCLRLSNADFWRYDIGRNGCKTFNYLEKYVSNSADTFFSKMILNIECSLGAKWVAHAHVGCLLHSHMSVLKRKQCLRSSFHWMTAQIILLCLLFSWRNSQSFALSYVYLFVCRLLIVRFPFFSIGIWGMWPHLLEK